MASTLTSRLKSSPAAREQRRDGLRLIALMVALLWVIELINTLDSNRLDGDGIYGRSVSHLWGILTSPVIHASFQHLISNTIPLVFCGAIIALRGGRHLALVTTIVVLVGGLGTWLIGPASVSTIGASGVVFGYSAYLIARGVFTRRVLEVLTGALVAIVLGGALASSLVPQRGVSWQGHLCGAIAGVLAAWLLSRRAAARGAGAGPGAGTLVRRPAG